LGVALVDRSTHPVSLSEAGQRFRSMAQDILHRLAPARQEGPAAAYSAESGVGRIVHTRLGTPLDEYAPEAAFTAYLVWY